MSIVLNKTSSSSTSNTPSLTTNTPSSTSNTPSLTTNTPSSTSNTTQPSTKINTTQSTKTNTSTQQTTTQPSTKTNTTQPITTSITKNELKPVNNSLGTIKIKNETKNISPEKLEQINKDYLTRLSNNPLQGIPNDKSKIKLPPKLQPQKPLQKPQQKQVESKLVQNPLLKNNKIDMKVVGMAAPKLPRRSIVKPKYTIKDLEDKDLKKKFLEKKKLNSKKKYLIVLNYI
jgi:hypothetical protein